MKIFIIIWMILIYSFTISLPILYGLNIIGLIAFILNFIVMILNDILPILWLKLIKENT